MLFFFFNKMPSSLEREPSNLIGLVFELCSLPTLPELTGGDCQKGLLSHLDTAPNMPDPLLWLTFAHPGLMHFALIQCL